VKAGPAEAFAKATAKQPGQARYYCQAIMAARQATTAMASDTVRKAGSSCRRWPERTLVKGANFS